MASKNMSLPHFDYEKSARWGKCFGANPWSLALLGNENAKQACWKAKALPKQPVAKYHSGDQAGPTAWWISMFPILFSTFIVSCLTTWGGKNMIKSTRRCASFRSILPFARKHGHSAKRGRLAVLQVSIWCLVKGRHDFTIFRPNWLIWQVC